MNKVNKNRITSKKLQSLSSPLGESNQSIMHFLLSLGLGLLMLKLSPPWLRSEVLEYIRTTRHHRSVWYPLPCSQQVHKHKRWNSASLETQKIDVKGGSFVMFPRRICGLVRKNWVARVQHNPWDSWVPAYHPTKNLKAKFRDPSSRGSVDTLRILYLCK